jgi:nucleoside-diphosphate-sugar epimerase
MNILVVGGTGLVGAHAALHLKALGHRVTVMSRIKPLADSPVAGFPHIKGSYLCSPDESDYVSHEQLAQFDWMLFAAGSDVRHKPEGVSHEHFYH